jgi:hypothetical protein
MSVSEVRANLNARIWQAIVQSGVDVSAIPQTEMDKLVGDIADNVLLMMDDMLAQVSGEIVTLGLSSEDAPQDSDQERVLWEGRPFLSLTEHYWVTSDRIRITRGLLSKDREDIELVRVQDIDQKQGIAERVIKIGDIFVRSHDPSDPQVVLRNVADPLEVHEIIRQAVLEARKKHRLYYREEM